MVSDLRSETKGFPVRVWLLAMCRGELSAVIARLMSKYLFCEVGGSGSEELMEYPPSFLVVL